MNHSFLGNWVLECFPVQKEGQSKAWWGRHTCGAGPLQIFTVVGANWKGGGGGLRAPGKDPSGQGLWEGWKSVLRLSRRIPAI